MEALAITLGTFLALATIGLAISVRTTLRDREKNENRKKLDAETINYLTEQLAKQKETPAPKTIILYAEGILDHEIAPNRYIDAGEHLSRKLHSELFQTLKTSGLIEETISDEPTLTGAKKLRLTLLVQKVTP